MNQKSLTELEYHRLADILKRYCYSVWSEEHVDNPVFYRDVTLLKKAQQTCQEMKDLLMAGYPPPLTHHEDIRSCMKKSSKPGAQLDAFELREIADICLMFQNLFCHIRTNRERCPELYAFLSQTDTRAAMSLKAEINRCIDDEAQIKSTASPELKSCRNKIQSLKRDITGRLDRILSSKSFDKILQDRFVSEKNGRYTVPVKKEMSAKFQGVIQDESQTGQTAFMEPVNIVGLNNKLVSERFNEEKEEKKILAELTSIVRDHGYILEHIIHLIGEVEYILARAEFAVKYKAVFPQLSEHPEVIVNEGKHPLLGDPAVPVTVAVTAEKPVLVISGPNAGGKTVAMKTAGIFILMTQSAIPIPAKFDTKIGLFDDIYTDIGDKQSIENSLSTFSSQLVSLKTVLENTSARTLVLMDEIATGTDPVQGEALAISVFEHFCRVKIPAILTTHYSGLKYAAISAENAENASVGYDYENMKPTFTLYMGIPGGSNAFMVAKNYQIPDSIIARARELETEENRNINEIIEELKSRCFELDKQGKELYYLKIDLEKRETELAKREQEISGKERVLKKDKLENLEQYIADKKQHIEEIIRSLSRKADRSAVQEVTQIREEVTEKKKEAIREEFVKLAESQIRAGRKTFIPILDVEGEITEINGNRAKVDCNGIVAEISVNDLYELSHSRKKETPKKKYTRWEFVANISPELNIIGMQCDEATEKLGKYIDTAFLNSLSQVRIIHGKGQGKLRAAVHELLKTNPLIDSFRDGDNHEGGTGATVAILLKRT